MPISLHATLVPGWLRLLEAGRGWLDKAEAFAGERDIPEAELLDARLIGDMHPFTYQVKSMAVHSAGAIEGVRAGVFRPDNSEPPASFAALRERLEGAAALIGELTANETESWIGLPMVFETSRKRLSFAAEDFLLAFSQCNFHFHATTAYGILRMRGVPLGKLDYLGRLPVRG